MNILRRSLVALALALVSIPAPALAQSPAAAQPQAKPSPAQVVASLSDQLRNLVSAQEYHFSKNTKYSNSLRELGYRAVEGAYVMVFRADARGWAGRAVHPDLPGTSCVIWVGPSAEAVKPTTDRDGKSGQEGAPQCDAP